MASIIKVAEIEDTGVVDPGTGFSIRASTATRKFFRKVFEDTSVSNEKLNAIIANDFAKDSGNIFHHFKSKKPGEDAWIEIRKSNLGYINYYISVIRDGYIDIIVIQPDLKFQPRSTRKKWPGSR
jgi:hypothetical protein